MILTEKWLLNMHTTELTDGGAPAAFFFFLDVTETPKSYVKPRLNRSIITQPIPILFLQINQSNTMTVFWYRWVEMIPSTFCPANCGQRSATMMLTAKKKCTTNTQNSVVVVFSKHHILIWNGFAVTLLRKDTVQHNTSTVHDHC